MDEVCASVVLVTVAAIMGLKSAAPIASIRYITNTEVNDLKFGIRRNTIVYIVYAIYKVFL